MAKTYPTIGPFTAGDILTAATMTDIETNLANQRVPPACYVRRTTDQTGFSGTGFVTWESAAYDTESPSDPMWASGANADRITIRTAGLYQVSFTYYITGAASITALESDIFIDGSVATVDLSRAFSTTSSFGQSHAVFSLTAGQYLQLAMSITGGSAYVVKGSATNNSYLQTRASATWLGQVS
jgi:hypothetical protein